MILRPRRLFALFALQPWGMLVLVLVLVTADDDRRGENNPKTTTTTQTKSSYKPSRHATRYPASSITLRLPRSSSGATVCLQHRLPSWRLSKVWPIVSARWGNCTNSTSKAVRQDPLACAPPSSSTACAMHPRLQNLHTYFRRPFIVILHV